LKTVTTIVLSLLLAAPATGFFTPQILAIVLGGALLLMGVIGGGFELKEVKIPQLGQTARVFATLCGALLLIVGLRMSNQNDITPPTNTTSATDANKNKPADSVTTIKQTTGRELTQTVAAKYRSLLQPHRGKQVEILYCPDADSVTFTNEFVELLQSAGLKTPHFTQSFGACSAEYGRVIARDPGLLRVLTDLLTEISGHSPLLQPEKVPHNDDDAAAIVIGSK
jgi:hypothetical protein